MTGVIERLPSDGGPSPYGITDEASGVLYVLDGGEGGYSAYEGQRVTVTGTARDSGASYENLAVSGITAAQGAGTTGPAQQQDRTATLSFEVETDCAPPQGTTLLGYVPAEGLISAVLSDPDGDGTYTGSVDVPRFAPGPAPEGTEPVSVPVVIGENVGDGSGNIETIKDFGQVKLDGDETFSASASFCGGGGSTTGGSTTGAGTGQYGQDEQASPSGTTAAPPAAAAPGAGKADGSTAVVSGDVGNADQGTPAPANTGADASAGVSSGGPVQGVVSSAARALPSSVANMLPDTGGLSLPVAGAAGALLLAGGLLFRRISR